MTNHRPAARSAVKGLVQLLTDRSPSRPARDWISPTLPVPASPRPTGDCPDWLALFLTAAAVVFFGIVLVHGFWELSK